MNYIKLPLRFLIFPLVFITSFSAPFGARADDVTNFRQALDFVTQGAFSKALEAAQSISPAARDVIEWHRLRAGEGELTEYEAFLKRRSDWPGLPYLKAKGESAAAATQDPRRVEMYFQNQKPRIGAGSVALVQAYLALGKESAAVAEAARAWKGLSFSSSEEAALLAMMPKTLAKYHEARLSWLMWEGDKNTQAEAMLPRVSSGARALAQARMALQNDKRGVTALIGAIPGAYRDDAGLAYDRFSWRMQKDFDQEAAALLLERSSSARRLEYPEAWAAKRDSLVRALLRDNDPKLAYRVASSHQLTSGGNFASLEFLSGFIALRKLNDPQSALRHFLALEDGVSTGISSSRALYWQGRAYEALNDNAKATQAYLMAAQYQTAYYGQLAAQKLGQNLDPALLSQARPGDWRGAKFMSSSVMEATLHLIKAGDRTLAKRFALHLGETQSNEELNKMADLMLSIDEPHIAVLIAKAAAERGAVYPRPYFPTPEIVPENLAVSRALALSIARRESEFDPNARSPAGALGLMQVMPGTAKLMANELNLPYSAARLTQDPTYNATLGSGYLKKLVDEFGPSIALIASGYNAGPGRPQSWIKLLGDPRDPRIDVVDWVEQIPFSETRTYVMRVAESVVIYRAKLRGSTGPVDILGELTGR
jgi:soluble lytic murein transglycosylase